MRYLKIFGLVVLVVALMSTANAGSALATELTSPTGTKLGVGTVFRLESEGHISYDAIIGNVECDSILEGHISNAGSSSTTVSGPIDVLSLLGCTNGVAVNILQNGSLEIHHTTGFNGTLTSSGTEMTVEQSGFHCIFKTSATDIGTLTGSPNDTSDATLDISATIPRIGGRSGAFCGSSAPWTGSFKVTKPTPLFID
jgi:hypothetical protein